MVSLRLGLLLLHDLWQEEELEFEMDVMLMMLLSHASLLGVFEWQSQSSSQSVSKSYRWIMQNQEIIAKLYNIDIICFFTYVQHTGGTGPRENVRTGAGTVTGDLGGPHEGTDLTGALTDGDPIGICSNLFINISLNPQHSTINTYGLGCSVNSTCSTIFVNAKIPLLCHCQYHCPKCI